MYAYQCPTRFTLAGYPLIAFSDQDVLGLVGGNPGAGRDAIRQGVARDVSKTTIWCLLRRMVEEGRLEVSGKGRATGYRIAGGEVVRAHLSTPYNRRAPLSFRPEFLEAHISENTWYPSAPDCERLMQADRP